MYLGMANDPGPSLVQTRSGQFGLYGPSWGGSVDVNDEHLTPVQGDTRTVKGMFSTFLQNFAQMSKTMLSVQKELNVLKWDRSLVKSQASSKKREPDTSGSLPPRKRKIIIESLYEQSDDHSDVHYSDKSDVDEALNTFIEGDASNQGSSDEDDESLALHELCEFFGEEDKTREPLSAYLAKVMEKMFS